MAADGAGSWHRPVVLDASTGAHGPVDGAHGCVVALADEFWGEGFTFCDLVEGVAVGGGGEDLAFEGEEGLGDVGDAQRGG